MIKKTYSAPVPEYKQKPKGGIVFFLLHLGTSYYRMKISIRQWQEETYFWVIFLMDKNRVYITSAILKN